MKRKLLLIICSVCVVLSAYLFTGNIKTVKAQSSCSCEYIRMCFNFDVWVRIAALCDNNGNCSGYLLVQIPIQICVNIPVCICLNIEFGDNFNQTCFETSARYGGSNPKASGIGAFFKSLVEWDLSVNTNQNWNQPDTDLLNDFISSEELPFIVVPFLPTQWLPFNSLHMMRGISEKIFAFDYRDNLNIEDSYTKVEQLWGKVWNLTVDKDRQPRSYGYINIPEDGNYSFAIKANRSTQTVLGPQGVYCRGGGGGYCVGDNTTTPIYTDEQEICYEAANGRTICNNFTKNVAACCDSCFTDAIYTGGICSYPDSYRGENVTWTAPCNAQCKFDYQGQVIMWLATQDADGDGQWEPVSVDTNDNFESNFDDLDINWIELARFESIWVTDPANIDDGNYWNTRQLKAGNYAFQISGNWPNTNPIVSPQLWWRQLGVNDISLWEEEYQHNPLTGDPSQYGAIISACTPVAANTCNITITGPSQVTEGDQDQALTVSLNSGSVDGIVLTSVVNPNNASDPAVLTVTPSGIQVWNGLADYTGFTFDAGLVDAGVTNRITITAYDSVNSTSCSDTIDIPIINTGGDWWQVTDADVFTTDLYSSLPSGEYFDLPGLGGFPGVAIYSGNTGLNNTNVSETYGWLVNSNLVFENPINQYDYQYFERKVPVAIEDIWEGTGVGVETSNITLEVNQLYSYSVSTGNRNSPVFDLSWMLVKDDSNLTIEGVETSMGDGKVVALVEGDLNINSDITLGSNGFLMLIVKGDVYIHPDVNNISAVIIANGIIRTGTDGDDSALNMTGNLIGWGGVDLERDLAVTDIPSESFTFDPGLFLRIPFSVRKIDWREVAP